MVEHAVDGPLCDNFAKMEVSDIYIYYIIIYNYMYHPYRTYVDCMVEHAVDGPLCDNFAKMEVRYIFIYIIICIIPIEPM